MTCLPACDLMGRALFLAAEPLPDMPLGASFLTLSSRSQIHGAVMVMCHIVQQCRLSCVIDDGQPISSRLRISILR